jgi:hypothetical protein
MPAMFEEQDSFRKRKLTFRIIIEIIGRGRILRF